MTQQMRTLAQQTQTQTQVAESRVRVRVRRREMLVVVGGGGVADWTGGATPTGLPVAVS